ncbi:hypothetical protein, partial [Streptomyces rhizosphaericus]|uniref:hypothetical protein n=1 Tax=Streptomyces rhizosphaericus TaxID=114699 RepID=UPI0031D0C53E
MSGAAEQETRTAQWETRDGTPARPSATAVGHPVGHRPTAVAQRRGRSPAPAAGPAVLPGCQTAPGEEHLDRHQEQ